MVSCTDYLFGEDEMALEMEIGNSCITMWMNVVYLNCAKNAQAGRFYVVCFTTNFQKLLRDSKKLSRNTALLKAVSATKPGFITCSLWISGCLSYVQSRGSFVRKLQAGCQRVCEYKNHAEGPSPLQGSPPHLPPSLHPTPFSIHSGCFKHDAKGYS